MLIFVIPSLSQGDSASSKTFFPISHVPLSCQKWDYKPSAHFGSNIWEIWLSFYLNLVNIRNEMCRPSLIINTICIWLNLQNIQGTFFVVSAGADYSRVLKI